MSAWFTLTSRLTPCFDLGQHTYYNDNTICSITSQVLDSSNMTCYDDCREQDGEQFCMTFGSASYHSFPRMHR